jgi:hypothetical protein
VVAELQGIDEIRGDRGDQRWEVTQWGGAGAGVPPQPLATGVR